MSGLITLTALAALFIVRKRKKLKKWYAVTAIVFIGACAFANTSGGIWTATGPLAWLIGLPAGWFDISTSPIAIVALLLLLVVVGYDIAKDHKADKFAIAGLILIPLLFLIATGPIASTGAGLTDSVTALFTRGLNAVSS